MIKKHYEITIREYTLMEQTGSIKQFAKFPNIIPPKILKREVTKQIDKLKKILNDSKDLDTENLQWEVISLTKINIIESSYLGAMNILGLGTTVDSYAAEMIRRDRRKIKYNKDNLSTYIGYLERFTGLPVKEFSALSKVYDELVFRKDKYKENFANKQAEEGTGNKMYLMAIVLGVFSFLDQPIDLDMTIVEFSLLRGEAIKKMSNAKTKE